MGCYFRFDNKMYTQGEDGLIFESSFGAHQGVTMLSVHLSSNQGMLLMKNVEDFIYDKETLLRLSRQYLKVLDPAKFMDKHQKSKEYDTLRDKTPARKEMHRNIDNVRNKKSERILQKQNVDEVRDKTPKRKEMHQNNDNVRNRKSETILQKQNVDEVRDKTPKRKEMQQKIDEVGDKTPKRKEMHKNI